MPEVLRLAADLYARDQAEIAQTEERRRLVEATEEAGLPMEYLERAAGILLERQDAGSRRSRRGRRRRVRVALAAVLALGVGWSLRHRPPPQPAMTSPEVTTPVVALPEMPPPAPVSPPGAVSLEGAAWSLAALGAAEGITPISGADGVTTFVTRGGRRCLAPQVTTADPSLYLYFQIEGPRAGAVSGPLYAVVEYFDASPGGSLFLEYDSVAGDDLAAQYRGAEQRSGTAFLGSRTWRTAIFLLEQPRFANRQNVGADFRLAILDRPIETARKGWPLYLHSVRLTGTRPAEWVRDAP
jgi:hypothetical protein